MVTNFIPTDYLNWITLSIAQEAGCSSGRVYVSAILSKMAILSNLLYAIAKQTKAINKDSNGLWRLVFRGGDKIQAVTEFRCAIADIIRNIKGYWKSANYHRSTIRKNLKWLESLGLFEMNETREKPIPSWEKVGGKIKTTYRSPDKQFLSFSVLSVLEAYQALEQLLNQQLDIKYPRRRDKQFERPDHAGMLARMLYTALMGRQYRAFSSLPENLEGMSAKAMHDYQVNKLRVLIDDITAQIAEQEKIGGATAKRIILELEERWYRAHLSLVELAMMMRMYGNAVNEIPCKILDAEKQLEAKKNHGFN
jgi:hypothetical protein